MADDIYAFLEGIEEENGPASSAGGLGTNQSGAAFSVAPPKSQILPWKKAPPW